MPVYTYYERFSVGYLQIKANDQAITHINYCDEASDSDVKNAVLDQCVNELNEYFEGKRKHFDVPVDFTGSGTDFQRSVWKELAQIPFGQTISYKMLANRISGSNYSRAVANANGKNPISIIIPCHRVIASDGGYGGYTGGLDKKKLLLNIEQA